MSPNKHRPHVLVLPEDRRRTKYWLVWLTSKLTHYPPWNGCYSGLAALVIKFGVVVWEETRHNPSICRVRVEVTE